MSLEPSFIIQLTLEQHRFELRGPTYSWIISPHNYMLQHYMICSWLNLWMRNRGYRGLPVKLHPNS